MIPASTFAGKTVALFGLGGSGLATARALEAGGAIVQCWDDGEAGRARAAAAGLTVTDLASTTWSGFSSLILSPGVPLTHPQPHWSVGKANAADVEIIGDIEIFFRERLALEPASPVICITGTNGKSTTTALIAHLLTAGGFDVQMGGNIGTNILDLAPPSPKRVHVIEVSTFQIDLTLSLSASIGVMINLTPDHLDRHGDLARYAAIKERVIASAQTAICGVDDTWSKAMADRRAAAGKPLIRFSTGRLPSGITARGTRIARMEGGEEIDIADLAGIASLRGSHNAQNAAASVAVALSMGMTSGAIQQALRSYASLPHRMEQIGSVGKTVFINDSKATNADSTRGALAGSEGLFWILGGKEKDGGIEDLRPLFGNVSKAYLIGHAAALFAATLDGAVPFERCGTLDVAVAKAASDAAASPFRQPVVLLSPACASYDQYKSFEHRGAHFSALAAALPGFKPVAASNTHSGDTA
ncbi:MAG: UDP-N-acetylmuramoyl-L-alanine--D-glutamate ligase [Beijerinckiaceae bacterium]